MPSSWKARARPRSDARRGDCRQQHLGGVLGQEEAQDHPGTRPMLQGRAGPSSARRQRKSPSSRRAHRYQDRRRCGCRPQEWQDGRGLHTFGFISHSPLEPQNTTAWHQKDPAGDKLEIWGSVQIPDGARTLAAKVVGVPQERSTLHQLRVGGGFWSSPDARVRPRSGRHSKQAGGIPVKLMWTREDDITHDFYRPGDFTSSRQRWMTRAAHRLVRSCHFIHRFAHRHRPQRSPAGFGGRWWLAVAQ